MYLPCTKKTERILSVIRSCRPRLNLTQNFRTMFGLLPKTSATPSLVHVLKVSGDPDIHRGIEAVGGNGVLRFTTNWPLGSPEASTPSAKAKTFSLAWNVSIPPGGTLEVVACKTSTGLILKAFRAPLGPLKKVSMTLSRWPEAWSVYPSTETYSTTKRLPTGTGSMSTTQVPGLG